MEDHDTVTAEQLVIIEELADITEGIAGSSNNPAVVPELVRRLRYLGGRCTPDIADSGVLSAQVVLAQSRSIIVDLLQVCGLSRESAVAVLAPTSSTPAFPPELWEE